MSCIDLDIFIYQLADFVKVPLELSGGMKNLIDIYCQYNRARGTGGDD